MSKHTPGPWKTEYVDETTFILDQYDDVILALDRNHANAAHIVKCVNMHEELLEACKLAIYCVDNPEAFEDWNTKMRAAIAKAEGKNV